MSAHDIIPKTGTVYLIGVCAYCAQVIVLGAGGAWAHVPPDLSGTPRLERYAG